MRLKLISCEVLYRELASAIARSPHTIDVEFLPKGLHDIGCTGMLQRLQTAVDAVAPGIYDAILLGYGLCNNGIAGLEPRHAQLVVPRAHDCMTLFLGSRDRYLQYFQDHPGTYFLTTGWIERGEPTGELKQLSIQHRNGMDMTYEELVAKYGEDNARYLWDQLCDQTRHYSQITFVRMGVEPDDSFERHAREKAVERQWSFETIEGSMRLVTALVNGAWDTEDFLIVKPGQRIAVSHTDGIITAEDLKP